MGVEGGVRGWPAVHSSCPSNMAHIQWGMTVDKAPCDEPHLMVVQQPQVRVEEPSLELVVVVMVVLVVQQVQLSRFQQKVHHLQYSSRHHTMEDIFVYRVDDRKNLVEQMVMLLLLLLLLLRPSCNNPGNISEYIAGNIWDDIFHLWQLVCAPSSSS